MNVNTSAAPSKKYCGICHRMLSGTASGLCTKSSSLARLSLLISTTAAADIQKTDMHRPMPIRCISVNPRSFPVSFLVIGTMNLSYTGTQKMTLTTSKVEREAGGIWKEPMVLSSIVPCSTNNVDIWAYTAAKTIPVAHMGNMRIRILNSSICVTVQSLHGSEKSPLFNSASEMTAALSRHLQEITVQFLYMYSPTKSFSCNSIITKLSEHVSRQNDVVSYKECLYIK